jgi:hypothetical protein
VGADLVRTPCNELCFDQHVLLETSEHLETRLGGLAGFLIYGGAVLMAYVGPQRLFCRLLIPPGRAHQNGMIELLGLTRLQLPVQRAVGFGCASEDHHAACHFIQPVNHPDMLTGLGAAPVSPPAS